MPRVKKNMQDGYNNPFAERLRELMEINKTSQAALAAHVGVTRQAISAYSLGASMPDIDKFAKIAEFFEVSADYLLGRTNVKAIDLTKQLVCNYLRLSEHAVTMIRLVGADRMEYDIVDGITTIPEGQEPLPDVLSLILETANLPGIAHEVYSAIMAKREFENSLEDGTPKLTDAEKEVVIALRKKGYLTVAASDQESYHIQSAIDSFSTAIRRIMEDEEYGDIDFL